MGFISKHLYKLTPPKQHPFKTTTQEYQDIVMVSID